jgi:integrase
MPKTINRLTDRTIRSLKAAGMHADGGGLFLQVSGDGGKSWILRYSLRGRAREMGLGSYRHLSLADARAECERYRQLLRDHIDPIEHRAQQRAANVLANTRNVTFREAAEQCIPIATKDLTNPKHAAQWTSTIQAYAYPVLKDMYVRSITVHDIHRVLEPIWSTKSETASRVRSRIERVMDWARVKGYCEGENPARLQGNLSLLLGKKKKAEHHPALPYAELPAFMARLREQKGTAARALEFTILTAARTEEIISAEPREVNAAEKLWTAPAEHMKRNREHLVPLCDRALELIREVAGEKFLFPNPDNTQAGLSNGAMLKLLERMGYDHVTVHGFRSTFKDWAVEKTAFEGYVSEAALAHAIGDKTEAAYNRSTYLAKRRRLMDAWAAYCEGVEAKGDNVTQLYA